MRYRALLRDILILEGLTFAGGFVLGLCRVADPGKRQAYMLILSVLLCVVGFAVGGALVKANRFRHLFTVAVAVWLIALLNVWLGATTIRAWAIGLVPTLAAMWIGGGISFLFAKTPGPTAQISAGPEPGAAERETFPGTLDPPGDGLEAGSSHEPGRTTEGVEPVSAVPPQGETPAFPVEVPETGGSGKKVGVGSAVLVLLGYVAAELGGATLWGIAGGVYFGLRGVDLHNAQVIADMRRAIEAPAALIGQILAGIVVMILVRHLARGAICGRSSDGIAWALGSPGELAKGFAAGVLVCLAYLTFAHFAGPPAPDLTPGPLARMASTPGSTRLYWAVMTLALAPPIEELLFRGVLFSWISNSWGKWTGAILSTALFVVLHIDQVQHYWPAAAGVLFEGAAALALRIRTSALGPAVVLHFAYNLVLVVLVFSSP